jgi:hypothetical protein
MLIWNVLQYAMSKFNFKHVCSGFRVVGWPVTFL